MNFLEITMFYYPAGGGSTKTTETFLDVLSKRGHCIYLVYPIFKDINSPSSIKLISSKKMENVVLCPVYIKPRFTYKYLKIFDIFTLSYIYTELFNKCCEILRNNDIDYIISDFHEITPIGLVANELSRLFKIRHILKVHDILPFITWSPDMIYPTLKYFSIRDTMQNCDMILFPNSSMSNNALNKYNFNLEKAIIFPNSLNMECFPEPNIREFHKTINLVFVGALYKNRRLDNLLYSIKEINDSNKNKLNLYIIGEGPEKNMLIRFIREYKIEEFIKICGALTYDKVLNIINNCHIGIGLLEKSPISEFQMPLKILEYMAAGLPWISIGHKGIVELSISNSGIVLKDSSIDSIKSAIYSLIEDHEKYRYMSYMGREYAKEHFDSDKNIEILLSLIEKQENLKREKI